MEPISLIVGALAAGAAAALKDTANQAVKSCYDGLKHLIKERFAKKADQEAAKDAEKTLTKYEKDPDTYEKPLLKELSAVQADQEQTIVQKAQQLIDLLKEHKEEGAVQQFINVSGHVDTMTNIGKVNGDVNIGTK